MIFIDTNIILRYLLDDNIELSQKAQKLIDSDKKLFLNDAVCAEVIYVLSKVYNVEREIIKNTLTEFFDKENIFTQNKEVIKKSLNLFHELKSIISTACFVHIII